MMSLHGGLQNGVTAWWPTKCEFSPKHGIDALGHIFK